MSDLKLAPRPLAKCSAVTPRPYPETKGVSIRRAPVAGRWLVERTVRGRTEAISVTTEELEQIVTLGKRALVAAGGK